MKKSLNLLRYNSKMSHLQKKEKEMIDKVVLQKKYENIDQINENYYNYNKYSFYEIECRIKKMRLLQPESPLFTIKNCK